MNKKDLVKKVAAVLRSNSIRKPISIPKQVFHISDDEGNKKDFIVRKTEKTVLYNEQDIESVLDACISVVEDALKHGDDVYIHGFGRLGVHKRAARETKHPVTNEPVSVSERYVPKFSFGNNLRMAAKIYGLSINEQFEGQVSMFDCADREDSDEP